MKAITSITIRLALLVGLFILTLSAGDGGVANVYIPAKQEFVLGEYEDSNFTAKLTNKGKQEVKIKIVDKKTEEQTQGFGLNPSSNYIKA